jgi:hypothetical protein
MSPVNVDHRLVPRNVARRQQVDGRRDHPAGGRHGLPPDRVQERIARGERAASRGSARREEQRDGKGERELEADPRHALGCITAHASI